MFFGSEVIDFWSIISESFIVACGTKGSVLGKRAVSKLFSPVPSFVLFQVVHDANTLYIFAPSAQSRDRWVKKLKEGKTHIIKY